MWDYYTAASDSVDSKLIELELQHHKTGIKCWHKENLDEMFQSFLIFYSIRKDMTGQQKMLTLH